MTLALLILIVGCAPLPHLRRRLTHGHNAARDPGQSLTALRRIA